MNKRDIAIVGMFSLMLSVVAMINWIISIFISLKMFIFSGILLLGFVFMTNIFVNLLEEKELEEKK